MPHSTSQTPLRESDKRLWTAADRLRSNFTAAANKHAVLGLIFLKYVSDSFAQQQAEIEEQFHDPGSDFHLSSADHRTLAKYEEAIRAELEGDASWKYARPPQRNANCAWIKIMLHHLAQNGSMSSTFMHLGGSTKSAQTMSNDAL